MRIMLIVVARAAFLLTIADAKLVGSPVITRAALVAFVTLAVVVCQPGVVPGEFRAAFNLRIART